MVDSDATSSQLSEEASSLLTESASDDDDAGDLRRVYHSVAAGDTAARLRRVIAECAQGSDERRARAVNKPGDDGEKPLEAASRLKRGDLVGALVETGANVRVLASGLATPIAVCCAWGQAKSVRALLRAGHDPSETFRYNPACGWCPNCGYRCSNLHLCLGSPAKLECLEALVVEGGADVNARDQFGRTPLFWLEAANDSKAALDLLLRLGADVNAHKWANTQDSDDDDDDDDDDNDRGQTSSPLIELIDVADEPPVQQCLTSCMRKFLSAGARAHGVYDMKGRSPLIMASERGHLGAARLLLEAGAPVDERNPETGEMALHAAALSASIPLITLLLDAGADINAVNSRGQTPIFSCARASTPAPLLFLLERGASPDVIDRFGETPLIVACKVFEQTKNRMRVVDELLRRSSPATCRALSDGRSALDGLVSYSWTPWRRETVGAMLALGVPVHHWNAARVLPVAASRAERGLAELAARRSESRRWRAHDDVVGLALDMVELREDRRVLEEKRRRLTELEKELGVNGGNSGGGGSGGGGSGGGAGKGQRKRRGG
jgi:ankyrin repeat protein